MNNEERQKRIQKLRDAYGADPKRQAAELELAKQQLLGQTVLDLFDRRQQENEDLKERISRAMQQEG